jgi:hypothetical protein
MGHPTPWQYDVAIKKSEGFSKTQILRATKNAELLVFH